MKLASAITLAIAGVARAHAYVDPGSGSVLLQMLGAAVAGGIFYCRELRRKIIALFSRWPAAPAEAPQSSGARLDRSS